MPRKKGTSKFTTISVKVVDKETLEELSDEDLPFCVKFERMVKEYKQMKGSPCIIVGETLKRLQKRQRPQQALAGVIEELLDLADKVDKTKFIDYPDLNRPQDEK